MNIKNVSRRIGYFVGLLSGAFCLFVFLGVFAINHEKLSDPWLQNPSHSLNGYSYFGFTMLLGSTAASALIGLVIGILVRLSFCVFLNILKLFDKRPGPAIASSNG